MVLAEVEKDKCKVTNNNVATCIGHTRPVTDICFTDVVPECNTSFILSGSKDTLPMLRRGDTGDWIGTYKGHSGAISSVYIDPSSSIALTGSGDYSAILWKAKQGEQLALYKHTSVVKAVDISLEFVNKFKLEGDCNGGKLATAMLSGILFVWDASRPDDFLLKLTGHKSTVRKVMWINNDQNLLSISDDKTMKVWDPRSSECIKTYDFEEPVTDLELCRSSRKSGLLTHGTKVSILRNLDTPEVVIERCINLPDEAHTASFHPFSKTFCEPSDDVISTNNVFVVGCQNHAVYKCNLEDGNLLEYYPKMHFGGVHAIRYSPDGHIFATASEDGTLRLWQNVIGETYGLWESVTLC